MSNIEKLIMLKAMVGASDCDEILSTYLYLAGKKVIRKAYPLDTTVTEVPDEYADVQVEIAAYLLNKRGAERQTGHSENGINRTYESSDVPISMLRNVVPYIGVVK